MSLPSRTRIGEIPAWDYMFTRVEPATWDFIEDYVQLGAWRNVDSLFRTTVKLAISKSLD
jgi:hypothetical protein